VPVAAEIAVTTSAAVATGAVLPLAIVVGAALVAGYAYHKWTQSQTKQSQKKAQEKFCSLNPNDRNCLQTAYNDIQVEVNQLVDSPTSSNPSRQIPEKFTYAFSNVPAPYAPVRVGNQTFLDCAVGTAQYQRLSLNTTTSGHYYQSTTVIVTPAYQSRWPDRVG
jgi:hypothetical protein